MLDRVDPPGGVRRERRRPLGSCGMKVLVTGGAGYIGSTTAKALEVAGHTPVILDSLLTGPRAFVKDRAFYEGDIADRALLRRIVDEHPDLDCTIHMAARIVVPESVAQPVLYYRDNVAKSLELFDELRGARQAAGGLLQLGVAVRHRRRLRGGRAGPARPALAVRPHQADGRADPRGHGRGHRAPGADPALLQPDRLRPGPGVRRLRARALARAGPAGPRRHRRSATRSRSPAPTTRPRTAPASATTCTSGTSPRRTSRPWSGSTTLSRPSVRRAA